MVSRKGKSGTLRMVVQIENIRPVVVKIILHFEISAGVIHVAQVDHTVW